MDYNEIYREKTKRFAVDIIKIYSGLSYTDVIGVIRKQIIRSSTSVAANYRSMCRARSEKERFSKLCIVVEEADETLFWLEITEEIQVLNEQKLIELKQRAEEILKITAAYKKNCLQNNTISNLHY